MPCKSIVRSPGKKPALVDASKTGHPATRKAPTSARAAKSPAARRTPRKVKRHTAAFYTLKSRQQAVQRAKLQIWRHLPEINGAVIKLAESGSYLAARTLFDFAGVYSLPSLEEDAVSGTVATESPIVPPQLPENVAPPVNRVEAFLKELGLDPLADDEPDPDMVA